MNPTFDTDRVLDAFLAPDHDELAGRVIDAALDEIARTQQRRDWLVPWRYRIMNNLARPAVAIALIAVAIGAIYVGGPRLGVGPVPSPTPSAPVETGATLDRGQQGYTAVVPVGWNSRVVTGGVYFSLPAPLVGATMWESEPAVGANPDFVMNENLGLGAQAVIRGRTLDELVASTNAGYLSLMSSRPSLTRETTIDGERAVIVEHVTAGPDQLWADVLVIHGDRAYAFVIDGPPTEDATTTLRLRLEAFISSIRWAR